MENTKWNETQTGSRLVSTTMPPRTACPTIPAGCAEASQTRSARRPTLFAELAPRWGVEGGSSPLGLTRSGRYRQAATQTTTAITKIATVTRRFPNSTQRWMSGSPEAPDATMLVAVHLGQSGQPRPDWLSRTPAPVMMMPAEATTPASAIRRIEDGDGASTTCASRQAQPRAPGARGPALSRATAPRAARWRDTDPMVGVRCILLWSGQPEGQPAAVMAAGEAHPPPPGRSGAPRAPAQAAITQTVAAHSRGASARRAGSGAVSADFHAASSAQAGLTDRSWVEQAFHPE